MPYDDTEQHYTEADRLKRQEQDGHDLQREIAGVQVGRQQRFLSPESHPEAKAEKERREYAELSALALRLQDAEYARLYYELADTITSLEQATTEAMQDVEKRIANQRDDLEQAEADATRLHDDGRMIFKSEDGTVRTADGEMITDPVLLNSIVWKEDAPTYEEYRAIKDGLAASEGELDELREYQTNVLGAARDRIEDEDNTMQPEEIKETQQRVMDQAPDAVRLKVGEDISHVPSEPTGSFATAKPPM